MLLVWEKIDILAQQSWIACVIIAEGNHGSWSLRHEANDSFSLKKTRSLSTSQISTLTSSLDTSTRHLLSGTGERLSSPYPCYSSKNCTTIQFHTKDNWDVLTKASTQRLCKHDRHKVPQALTAPFINAVSCVPARLIMCTQISGCSTAWLIVYKMLG